MPTDKEVEEMDNKDSHPFSQSLKRMTLDTPDDTLTEAGLDIKRAYNKGTSDQYAADQSVVAELEKQIETLKAESEARHELITRLTEAGLKYKEMLKERIPKELIAWLLRRLNIRDSADLMLWISVGKLPEGK